MKTISVTINNTAAEVHIYIPTQNEITAVVYGQPKSFYYEDNIEDAIKNIAAVITNGKMCDNINVVKIVTPEYVAQARCNGRMAVYETVLRHILNIL